MILGAGKMYTDVAVGSGSGNDGGRVLVRVGDVLTDALNVGVSRRGIGVKVAVGVVV